MASIKNDPSQNKTVAALLIVLVIAVGATIVRVKKTAAPVVAAQAAPVAAQPQVVNDPFVSVDYTKIRNPFGTPAFLASRDITSSQAPNANGSRPVRINVRNPWRSAGHVPPFDIQAVRPDDTRAINTEDVKPKDNPEQPAIKFTLLATVRNASGLCGIIKRGNSEARVVKVGDTLEDGFRVKALDDTHATLTDGRTTIVARRPQS